MASWRLSGPVPITCTGMPGSQRGRRDRQVVVQRLAGVQVPVHDEELLHVARGRPLDAHRRVDPGREARLRREGGGGHVVRARVGHVPVDDGELAVVAQVDARSAEPQARGQGPDHAHAAVLELAPQPGLQEGLRAHRVHQEPAAHAARRRAQQGRAHGAAGLVVEEDVVEQMDVVGSPVEIGGERGHEALAIRQELEPVAPARHRLAHQVGQVRDRARHVRQLRRARLGRLTRRVRAHAREDLAVPPAASHAGAHVAEQEEARGPGSRQEHDQQDPGQRRGLALRRPHEHEPRHADLESDPAEQDEQLLPAIGHGGIVPRRCSGLNHALRSTRRSRG